MSNLNTNLNAAASDGHGVRETHTLVLNQASPDIVSSAVEANESNIKNLVSSLCEAYSTHLHLRVNKTSDKPTVRPPMSIGFVYFPATLEIGMPFLSLNTFSIGKDALSDVVMTGPYF